MSDERTETSERKPAGRLFATTHWSLIGRAQQNSAAALESLCATYREPLLVWLRGRGLAPEDAEDVVQGFFQHLLERDFLAKVQREKGRFRTFLLNSLQNHFLNERRRANAAKRGGGRPLASLDETDGVGTRRLDPAAPTPAPDLAFDKAWAQAILGAALRRLEAECARNGHSALCAAVEPVLFCDDSAAPYRQLGQQLGLSENAVKVSIHRIRARLKGLIRDEVRQTVTTGEDWEAELGYLTSLFGS